MKPAENDEGEDEKRGGPRRRVLKSAKIVYNAGHSVMDCSVQNLSDTGARLRLQSPAVLPDDFDLHLADGRKLHVEVIWRSAATLGVRFAGRNWRRAQPGSRKTGETLLDRISEIEAQLAELRRDLIVHLYE